MRTRNLAISYIAAFIIIAAMITLGLRGNDVQAFDDRPLIKTSQAHSAWLTDTLMHSPAKTDVSSEDEIRLITDPFDRPNVVTMQSFPRGQLIFGSSTDGAYNDFAAYLQIQKIEPSFVKSKEIFTFQKATSEKPISASYISWCSLFDPQFSPNGKYILFKFGHIFQPNYFHVYVFDLQTHRTHLIEKEVMNYDALSWSPDSNYIALAKGGGDAPRRSNPSIPYDLCLINWRTGKSYTVIKSTSMRAPWSWLAPHTLIYGALPTDIEKSLNYLSESTPHNWQRLTHQGKRAATPNLYSYSIGDAKPKLFLKNGYIPSVSPDGRTIAYFQLIHPQDVFGFPGGSGGWNSSMKLVIAPLHKSTLNIGKPVVLHQYATPFPRLTWKRDGKHLLVLHEREDSAEHYSLDIEEWNVEQKKSRIVATINATGDNGSRSVDDPVFPASVLSPDGQKLMLTVDDYYPVSKGGGVQNMDTLKEIDLPTGNVKTVAIIKPSFGSAWHYQLSDKP